MNQRNRRREREKTITYKTGAISDVWSTEIKHNAGFTRTQWKSNATCRACQTRKWRLMAWSLCQVTLELIGTLEYGKGVLKVSRISVFRIKR